MMAWEHLVLGDLEPGAVSDFARLEAHCELLAELGRRPLDPDPRLPRDADVIQLPGSGVLVTTGELNVLPDYFDHPDAIAAAPAACRNPASTPRSSKGTRATSRRCPGTGGGPFTVRPAS